MGCSKAICKLDFPWLTSAPEQSIVPFKVMEYEIEDVHGGEGGGRVVPAALEH